MAIRFHRTAVVAGVKDQEAVAFATEISKYTTETLGMPTTWGMQIGGTFPTIHWFTDFENMTELEAGLVKTLTDAGYIEILAKAKDLFIEGRSEDSMIYMM
jgi:hypothetical protein